MKSISFYNRHPMIKLLYIIVSTFLVFLLMCSTILPLFQLYFYDYPAVSFGLLQNNEGINQALILPIFLGIIVLILPIIPLFLKRKFDEEKEESLYITLPILSGAFCFFFLIIFYAMPVSVIDFNTYYAVNNSIGSILVSFSLISGFVLNCLAGVFAILLKNDIISM